MGSRDEIKAEVNKTAQLYREFEVKWENEGEKQCLHPDCDSKEVIKSHSIQNNKVLEIIADKNDMLMTFARSESYEFFQGFMSDITNFLNDFFMPKDESRGQNTFSPLNFSYLHSRDKHFENKKSHDSSIRMSKVPRRKASIFQGFCDYHDGELFKSIELDDYTRSKVQNFFFAYRALSYEYLQLAKTDYITAGMTAGLIEKNGFMEKEELSAGLNFFDLFELIRKLRNSDMAPYFQKFSVELQKKEPNYEIIISEVFEVPFSSLIATSVMFNLRYDVNGNEINNIFDANAKLHPLFLNIIPQNDKTHVIFSCFEFSIAVYSSFFGQMKNLSNENLQKTISNIVISYARNFFVSPKKYNALSNEEKEKISILYSSTERSGGPTKEQLNEDPPVNLFQKFREKDE